MFKSLTTAVAAIVLVLGLAGCGDEKKPSTSAGAAAGKDTTEGCLAAVKKLFAEATETTSPDSLGDEPPPECDDLSTEQQQQALSKAIEESIGELGEDLKKDLEELNTPTP
jgi:hypothetical protein